MKTPHPTSHIAAELLRGETAESSKLTFNPQQRPLMSLKIYIASSRRDAETEETTEEALWLVVRDRAQQAVVTALREQGHIVYDFRNPQTPDELDSGSASTRKGFAWSDLDPSWENWSSREFRDALDDYRAVDGFKLDSAALRWCDVVVLLLPSGRSAHIEAGWAAGAGKDLVIYLDGGEPELMYRCATTIVIDEPELVLALAELGAEHKKSIALKNELMGDD